MSTTLHYSTWTKHHGVKGSLSTPDLHECFQHPSPHGSTDQLPPSTPLSDDALSTQLLPTQKIRRKRYAPSDSDPSASMRSSRGSSENGLTDGDNILQPRTHFVDNVLQRSLSADAGTAFITDNRCPTSASATSTPTIYPLPLNPPLAPRPLVALRDDDNTPSPHDNQLQEPTPCIMSDLPSRTPTQLPEFTPFSPAFNSSFYQTQSFSPTQFRFGSPISSPIASRSASPSRRISLSPTPSPSRVSFANPPRGSIPPAIAPPRRSSLYLGSLTLPSSPASSHFSRNAISSSNHASTSSLGSGSRGSVLSLPLSPLTPSIPITPPPEELRRRRMEKLDRTLGVVGVGILAVSKSGSGFTDAVDGDMGKAQNRELGSIQGTVNGVRDRPPRSDSLSTPSERVIIAPWDVIPPPDSAKPKSLTRKLTKSKSKPAQPHPQHEPASDPKSKVRRIPAPIVILPAPSASRPQQQTSQDHQGGDSRSHEKAGDGEGGATIITLESTPTILLSPSPSRSPTHLPSTSPPSPTPSSSSSGSTSSREAELQPRSRSGSLSSISYAPASPVHARHKSPPPLPTMQSPSNATRHFNDDDIPKRGRGKDFGAKRRSRSVSHIYNGSRVEDLIPPLPSTPLTPRSTRAAILTKTLKSLDGHGSARDWIKGERKDKDNDEAKARRRKNMDSLGYPIAPLKSSSQTSLISQRYAKPASGHLLSSYASSVSPSGSTTTLPSAFSSPSASTSALNLPAAIRNIPTIPNIHVSRPDLPPPKSLKRSTSFSLLKMAKGTKDVSDARHARFNGDQKGSNKHLADAATEWRAQLQKSEREVLGGFRMQASHHLPLSQPGSRSHSRAPSRQPSRGDINALASTSATVSASPSSYFAPPPSNQHHVIPFVGVIERSNHWNNNNLSPSPQAQKEEYGRIDHRVRGRGWSGEWNLPLEEVIKGLRTIQSS